MIPIFDSLTHPTCDESWVTADRGASFVDLAKDMEANGFIGACAVGLPGVGNYKHTRYASLCNDYPSLCPIAGLSMKDLCVDEELSLIKNLGYQGIKLHSKYSQFDLKEDRDALIEVLNACQSKGLVVFLCTYMAADLGGMPGQDPYWQLISILKEAKDVRLILTHGGLYRLFEYADLVRFNPNLLLDLSYTMMKYKGSSLDGDLRYLLKEFDQRICIGSDHPEYSLSSVRKRAEALSSGISQDKIENAFHKNLQFFLRE